jgi:hypothetical protein
VLCTQQAHVLTQCAYHTVHVMIYSKLSYSVCSELFGNPKATSIPFTPNYRDLTLLKLKTNFTEQNYISETNKFSAPHDIPHVIGTRMFITFFTIVSHLFLSSPITIQSTPILSCFYNIHLILPSSLCVVTPSGHFRSGIPTISLLPHTRHLY